MHHDSRQALQRVGETIRARRAELRLTQEQLADRCAVSLRTVQNAEAGTSVVRSLTRAQLEQALGWEPGTLTGLYREPVPVEVYSPKLAAVLSHPAICGNEAARELILRELHQVHVEFAQRIARAFRLT